MISGFMNSTLDQKWLGRLRQRGYYEQEYLLLGMGWTRNGYKILAGKRESKRQFGLSRGGLGYKTIKILKIGFENVKKLISFNIGTTLPDVLWMLLCLRDNWPCRKDSAAYFPGTKAG